MAARSAHGRRSAVPSVIVTGGGRIGGTGISMPIIDGPILKSYSLDRARSHPGRRVP